MVRLPNNLSLEMAKARLTMKERARQGEKCCKIYREVCAAASEDLKDFLPSASVCARTMRKARSETHPTEVVKLADLIFDGDWLTTGAPNRERFLQGIYWLGNITAGDLFIGKCLFT